ncbi:hypothetical protein [Pontimicrobium sp. MEBiC06410]
MKKTNYLNEQQIFKNLTFNEFFSEANFTTKEDILFHECIFNQPLALTNIKAREFSFFNCKFNNDVIISDSSFFTSGFTDCVFEKELTINNNIYTSYFTIRKINANNIKISGECKNLQIVESKIEELNILDINTAYANRNSKIEFLVDNNIDELKIEPHLTFSQIIFKGGKYQNIFFEGTFNNRIFFEKKTKVNSLFFESSYFKKRIDFQEGNFNNLYFYRSNFNGLIYINDFDNIKITDSRDLSINELWLHSCNFDKDVSVSIGLIKYITLSNNNFKQHFHFNNWKNEDDFLLDLEPVMIRSSGNNRGTILIERTYLDITLGGINFGDIFIKDSTAESIFILDIDNKGSLTLNNINHCDYFTIQNSVSGKLNFINTNINTFKEIVIADSNIENTNFTKYPKKILSYSSNPKVGYGLSDKSKNKSNLKSIYNQLKQIAKKKGDIDIANKYQSLEYKQLLLSKRISSDTFLLFLNWISNNNGRSWFRGVLFTFSIGFIFFNFYLYVLGLSFNYNEHLKEFIIFFTSFPKLQLDKYAELNGIWQASLIIWLSRIFISYGIYQTVSAFRKYGKG